MVSKFFFPDIDIFLNIKEKIIDFCHKLLENQNTELQVLGIRGLGALSLWSDILSVQEVTAAMEKLTVEAVQTESDAARYGKLCMQVVIYCVIA